MTYLSITMHIRDSCGRNLAAPIMSVLFPEDRQLLLEIFIETAECGIN